MDRQVKIRNMVNAQVGVNDSSLGVKRVWGKKGQLLALPYEIVEQLLWSDGFKRMIDSGMLYIEDMQDKKDLGIEPIDAETPVNIIVLSDKRIEELMTSTPIDVFKKEILNVPRVQVDALIEYSIDHQLVDSAKCTFLKKLTGKDIFKAISVREEDRLIEERERKRQEYAASEGRR